MNYSDLVTAVQSARLDANRLVDFVSDAGEVSASVAYSIVATGPEFAVLAGMGRGELTELPDDGYRFASESDACEFVWRHIRSTAAPDLLSDDEEELLRREAAESIARQTAAYEAEAGH
ncbi:hypothetical protein [Frondihabitans australicus]|uniref:Uncharacterized protein n=1 Tax=Frondihabitans australicus TaxID=386892 RepID=A0A495IEK8_9MICO|nr:hypothetical protein [Frondihabitans australicus]RKR73938.1 hypothetical protein C8E83_1038 [Frondihabitans australicus]